MKVQVELEDISSVKKKLRVEVGAERAGPEFERILADFKRYARLPGFRPGKAPVSLVKSRYRKEIEGELFSSLVPKAYGEAIEARGLDPVGEPRLDGVNYSEKGPLTFTALLEVVPEFDLPTYRGLSVSAPRYTAGDKEVAEELDRLRESHSNLVSVEDRGVEDGDIAVFDMEGRVVDSEGVVAENPEIQETDAITQVGAENTHPAFNRALTALRRGDEETFQVDYPADAGPPGIAGKSVSYRIVLKTIKRRDLPDLDDDFAKDLGAFETLEELKSKVLEQLERNAQARRDEEIRKRLFEQIVAGAAFEVPEAMVESRIDQKIRQVAYNMVGRGIDPRKVNLDWGKLRRDCRTDAEDEVRFSLILTRIAASEGLDVGPQEVSDELERLAADRGRPVEKLSQELGEAGMDDLKVGLKRQKAMDLILDCSSVSDEK